MYFKVTDANMRSVYSKYQGKYAVQYCLGEYVRPIAGQLFVYGLSDVRFDGFTEYSEYNQRHINERRLWLCECINPIRKVVHICDYDEVSNMYDYPEKVTYYDTIVVQADAVKLIQEITLNDLRKLCTR